MLWSRGIRLHTALLITASAVVGIFFFVSLLFQSVSAYRGLQASTRSYQDTLVALITASIRQPLVQGSFVEAQQRLQQSLAQGQVDCVSLKLNTFAFNDCRTLETSHMEWRDVALSSIAELSAYSGFLKFGFDNSGQRRRFLVELGWITVSSLLASFVIGLLITGVFRLLEREADALVLRLSSTTALPSIDFRTVEFAQFAQRLGELVSTRTKLEQSEAYSNLAKSVAHDMRSPISTLRIVSQKIGLTAQIPGEILAQAAARLESIAAGLLSAALDQERARAGLPSLAEKLRELSLEYRTRLPQSILLNSILPQQLPAGAQAALPVTEIVSIVDNLIKNSMEALGSRSGTISLELSCTPGWLRIQVSDDGPGFPAKVLSQVGRARVTDGKEAGTGFGLFLSAAKVNGAGGELVFSNPPGGGACVVVKIPCMD